MDCSPRTQGYCRQAAPYNREQGSFHCTFAGFRAKWLISGSQVEHRWRDYVGGKKREQEVEEHSGVREGCKGIRVCPLVFEYTFCL